MKEDRIIELQKYILRKQDVSFEELKSAFPLSDTTLRRYIKYLKSQKLIETYYGGVRAVLNTIPFDRRFDKNIVAKHEIGLMASQLVEPGDTVFIDSGTTTIHVIDCLKSASDITIVTNNINVINVCKRFPNYNIILLGGEFVSSSNCCANYDTIKMMKKYNFDKAFIAANGITIERGATNSDSQEHDIKRLAIKQARQSILLIDHTKFDKTGLQTFAPIEIFKTIITDQEPSSAYINYMRLNDVNLIITNR